MFLSFQIPIHNFLFTFHDQILNINSTLFYSCLLAGDINPNPGRSKCLNVFHANIRSINNKCPVISKFISYSNIDLFRHDTTSANLCAITPQSHKLLPQPREAHLRGVQGVFIKNGQDASVFPTQTCTTFENFLIKISLDKDFFTFKMYIDYHLPVLEPFLNSFSHFWKMFISQLIT